MAKKRKKIQSRLDSIDKEISKIEKEEVKIEKIEGKVQKKITDIAKEEQTIEKTIVKIGRINLRKRHLFELLRASAGAFLGVGLGRSLIGLDNLAKNLPWSNVIGILVFILGLSALLIYKDEKTAKQKVDANVVWQKLFFIYAVSIFIEYLSLLLFSVQYDSTAILIKIIIVGSYTAMASAVTFSLGK